ncbi:patatin-like phospholipase family protein [Desulfobotulus sp. H1]|uniref:Patatin-like phospholipase family protein n=1 Tax=Desulfobotulus pelophilus TaxID=2823377 RepID=A0ABT3NA01_9BACT|nr:patatin-like phospholipase family protein [Desulfobotulus pelophilus]MCW7754279.1 patatin-like phospholipase family protein [Desulfobotulus pelophilus]
MTGKKERKVVDLALQGGGSHGALTWGVLDRLLDDDRIEIATLSGTSAGAMNAVVVAAGMDCGGRKGAREALEYFWKAVSDGAMTSPIQRSIWDRLTDSYSMERSPGYLFFEQLSRQFSPYELNPMNINPLRDLVSSMVDFDCVNHCTDIRVFVTATNVRTGRGRTFTQPEISVDAVMASACLPLMFQAVEIDGEAYWDGGYIGNPALYPLVEDTATRDLIVVQINPMVRDTLPKTSREIINRINEITFNSSLIKELRSIELLHQIIASAKLDSQQYRDIFVHIIHAHEDLKGLEASSKMNAEWSYLQYLNKRGWQWADRFLADHFEDLGQRSTFNLKSLFTDSFQPPEVDETMDAAKKGKG